MLRSCGTGRGLGMKRKTLKDLKSSAVANFTFFEKLFVHRYAVLKHSGGV